MEKEIKISGLTKQQVTMLDTMWSKGNSEDYTQWKGSLPKDKQQMADALEAILIMELHEENLDQVKSEAHAAIAKMMQK